MNSRRVGESPMPSVMEPKTLMERQICIRKRRSETPGTSDSNPFGCLTVSKNPSIFLAGPESAGGNPGGISADVARCFQELCCLFAPEPR